MNLFTGLSNRKHEKQVIVIAIACGMLLVLPSCAQLREAKPAPGLPADFNGTASPENSALLSIEQFFNDPVLTCLICQGLANNRELKMLEEEVQIAQNEILARKGAYLPFLGIQGGAALDRPSQFTLPGAGLRDDPYLPGRFFPSPLPDYLMGLTLFWQLDIWRELRNARDAANQRYLAACERRNAFVTRLVADIAETFYTLMSFDQRLENLDRIIALQQRTLSFAEKRMVRPEKQGALGTLLPVERFRAEVRKNQSQRLIVRQDIIQAENRINFLVNRFPQPVERKSSQFFDLNIPVEVGIPAQLLQFRPDVRQAERELEAAGLDVKVARAHFFPRLTLTGGIGYEAFNPRFLFWTPQAVVANIAAGLTGPLINRLAIQAEYKSANARQLESIYKYQRVVLNAFTEVVTRLSKVRNYTRSVEIKRQQVQSLVSAVDVADKLFRNVRIEYVDVLFAQRDLFDARYELIEAKLQQLTGVVNTYQALGGGLSGCGIGDLRLPQSCPTADPGLSQSGPVLGQSTQSGGDQPGPELLPVPRKIPDQLPAPAKQPERLPG